MSLEEYLLQHIDIKYFRNNPEYISKWQEYYHNSNQDIKIILLMKYKKISIDYHWIYIELSSFFARRNKPEISVFILNEALRNEVYDIELIKQELLKYKDITCASVKEASKYLNPIGFKCLGRTWNEIKACTFYNPDLIKNMSFEEYRYKLRKRDDYNILLYSDMKQYISAYMDIYSQGGKRKRYKHLIKNKDQFKPLTDILQDSPDLISLYYIYKTLKYLEEHNQKCWNISGFYLTHDLTLTYAERINMTEEEMLFNALIKPEDIQEIKDIRYRYINLFKEYMAMENTVDIDNETFVRMIEEVIKKYDVSRLVRKYHIKLCEQNLRNLE